MSFFTTAQENNSTGLVMPSEQEMVKFLSFQSDYMNGGEKIYARTEITYGDANASSFDLRDVNALTGAKDQGSCGSCWSFSAITAVESSNLLRNKEKKDFF